MLAQLLRVGNYFCYKLLIMDITTQDTRSTMTGSSTQGIKTVLHPVSDLATAKAVYALLGVPPQTDESYYVGFEAEGQHIGLLPGVDRRA
jgi:hypothetical protein